MEGGDNANETPFRSAPLTQWQPKNTMKRSRAQKTRRKQIF